MLMFLTLPNAYDERVTALHHNNIPLSLVKKLKRELENNTISNRNLMKTFQIASLENKAHDWTVHLLNCL